VSILLYLAITIKQTMFSHAPSINDGSSEFVYAYNIHYWLLLGASSLATGGAWYNYSQVSDGGYQVLPGGEQNFRV
jgi:hypothetical protein